MKLDMCRGIGWICVDLGLGREMMFPRIYVIKIEIMLLLFLESM